MVALRLECNGVRWANDGGLIGEAVKMYILTIVCSVAASNGRWKRIEKHNNIRRQLPGKLAKIHDWRLSKNKKSQEIRIVPQNKPK